MSPILLPNDPLHRKAWALRRAELERRHFLNWRDGTNGFWRHRMKHEAILFFGTLLKLAGFFKYGERAAARLTVREITLFPPGLPEAFRGYRILHLSDLHLDGAEGLGARIAEAIAPLSCDLAVITGDFRYDRHGAHRQILAPLRQVLSAIKAPDGVFTVLGNHDTRAMVPDFEAEGLSVLTNQWTFLERGGERISLVGVDDPHDYLTPEAGSCLTRAGEGFRVLLAHSPELYAEAAAAGISLYLCGHSHGGQICLPGGVPLLTCLEKGKRFYRGAWRFGKMLGYTSPGAGTAKIPVRVCSPAEVTRITLS